MRIPNGRRARKTGSRASAGNIRPLGATWMTASRWRAPVVFSALAAGAVLAAPAVASASPFPSPVTGHVYLDDNTAGANTIAAFDRHANGSLTPLPGSPFNAGGAGTGAGLASEGAVQIADGGRFLLAVDAGSNQVSALRVEPDGSLRLASVAASNGALPVSIAVHGSLVYVANAGPADTNYTGLRLAPWGSLTPILGSTVALPAAAQPGDVLFNGTGSRADRHPGGNVTDRQLHRGTERAANGSRGLAVHRPGNRPVRQPVPAGSPQPAVRVQRPQRRRARHGLGLQRLGRRGAHLHRELPRSRPADGTVLGHDSDQPGRPLPVPR